MIPEPVLQAFGVGETLPVRLPGGHDLACRAAHPQTDRRRILFAAYHEPAVLDFSPYWRPAGFAAAVLVADAAVWEGANPEALFSMASPVEQLVVRAELRRLLELDGHAGVAGARRRHLEEAEQHAAFVTFLARRLTR